MGISRIGCLLASAGLLAACSASSEDDFRCNDPKYGNGTCDLDTTCGAPDIDCFVRFKTPEDARTWYDAQSIAASRGPSLPPSDPRFAAMQSLIDEGWEGYKATHEVGDLAGERVQLVLVNNSTVNAFALADSDHVRAGLAVMVHTGLIAVNAPKEQTLGVIMHEFEHAASLHVNPVVKAAMTRYYKTPATSELLGYAQDDDAAVRAQFEAWSQYADIAGYASDTELSGMPLMVASLDPDAVNDFGVLGPYFRKLVLDRKAAVNTTACNNAVAQLTTLFSMIFGTRSVLDDDFSVPASLTPNIAPVLTAVRDQCFMGVTGDAIANLAPMLGATDAAVRAEFPADLRAQIEGKTVINGWFGAVLTARTRMREIENGFMTTAGVPWSRLRYYSTEEAADDSSARTMLALGLAPDGTGRLLVSISPGLAAVCNPLLAGTGQIPYGQKLPDAHHATCWRARHQQAIGADKMNGKLAWRPVPRGPVLAARSFAVTRPWMD